MDKNTTDAFDAIEKAIRPEVTKEQLGMVIEHLMEAIESIIEVPEQEDMKLETEDSEEVAPVGDPMKNEVNWPVTKSNENDYISDNEDEDKWDNIQKACWSGYKQVGMKDKNGKMVPNCVPVEKAHDTEDKEEPIKKSIWDGTFIK